MNKYKINFLDLCKVYQSNKTFALFNIKNNSIKDIILTNDLNRYRNLRDQFRVIDILKTEINKNLYLN